MLAGEDGNEGTTGDECTNRQKRVRKLAWLLESRQDGGSEKSGWRKGWMLEGEKSSEGRTYVCTIMGKTTEMARLLGNRQDGGREKCGWRKEWMLVRRKIVGVEQDTCIPMGKQQRGNSYWGTGMMWETGRKYGGGGQGR